MNVVIKKEEAFMPVIDIEKIKKAGDYIRYLSLFCVEMANSGHPGLPLGCADIGVVLFRYILKYNPEVPNWLNRDRFFLSAGHGSMLIYSLLHCAGYGIKISDLTRFRQAGSITAGHPEYCISNGIEATTGPLGQGFANAVGAAIEGKMLAARFNKDNYPLFDYTVYTLMGDGCNMEGISYEAGSLAGHLGLDNIIAIYDSNDITIDGSTKISFTEDVGKRYEALGWHVEKTDAGHIEDFYHKINQLKDLKGKPKLIIVKTKIGEGLNKVKGTKKAHGTPAGPDEIAYFIQNSRIKKLFQDTYGTENVENAQKLIELCRKDILEKNLPFESPEDTAYIHERSVENQKQYNDYKVLLNNYNKLFPEKYKELSGYLDFHMPADLKEKLLFYKEDKADATRNISGRILNICAEALPQIAGGAADLVKSTKAFIKSSGYINRNDFSGRNIAFGIREHAMGSICNGMALNRVLLPFSSTFFTFFDYMKPSVRLAAIMKIKHLFVFSHDSIYVGEDGPTHQPIEQLNALRLIPGIFAFRPANDIETAFSYLYYLTETDGPAAIICTRQNVSEKVFHLEFDHKKLYDDFKKGAYIIYESPGNNKPEIILGGSGSETGLALEAAGLIEKRDEKKVRVISVPCLELFNKSENDYRDHLLENGSLPFVFIEAASHRGVNFFYGKNIHLIDIEDFGYSGPANKVAEIYGFTPETVYSKIKKMGL